MKDLKGNKSLPNEEEKRKENLEPKGSLETSIFDVIEKFFTEVAERGEDNSDLGEYTISEKPYYSYGVIEPTPTEDTIPEGPSNPNYGHSMSNPVLVRGFSGVHKYLAKLRTPDGRKLNWERRGSSASVGKYGPSDIYQSFLEDETSYITILINMYGEGNATAVPTGFILVED